jgi:hypothetical protein
VTSRRVGRRPDRRLVIDKTSDANFVPVNDADDWLHFGLGVGMVALGALAWRPDRRLDRS